VGVPLSGQYFFELGLYFPSEYVLSQSLNQHIEYNFSGLKNKNKPFALCGKFTIKLFLKFDHFNYLKHFFRTCIPYSDI
jgi:hypothetical protein